MFLIGVCNWRRKDLLRTCTRGANFNFSGFHVMPCHHDMSPSLGNMGVKSKLILCPSHLEPFQVSKHIIQGAMEPSKEWISSPTSSKNPSHPHCFDPSKGSRPNPRVQRGLGLLQETLVNQEEPPKCLGRPRVFY